MKHAHDPAFEQGLNVLDPIHMNLSVHIGPGMVHGLLSKLRTIQPEIADEFVGMHLRSWLYILPYEIRKGAL